MFQRQSADKAVPAARRAFKVSQLVTTSSETMSMSMSEPLYKALLGVCNYQEVTECAVACPYIYAAVSLRLLGHWGHLSILSESTF